MELSWSRAWRERVNDNLGCCCSATLPPSRRFLFHKLRACGELALLRRLPGSDYVSLWCCVVSGIGSSAGGGKVLSRGLVLASFNVRVCFVARRLSERKGGREGGERERERD